ncbi:nitroreductase family protein [Thermotoga sp. KOL6]|uniref:nitroreductase family protein n=1 Tax=Thermotoga sp. KOL6 TaxID=126741 RepID=UPI000C7851C2|nr:nitroreductase family protein [Thermotoga sp. KOL6]PLV59119.1 NADH dehydrogenase [Thermotoga sp. KOL6]
MSIIYKRRSIRKYQKKDVPDELVIELIRAAMHAPSACNQQPWHFVVIRDERTKRKIAELHPYAKMAAEAPVVILVCGDPTLEECKGFWVQDCSAAVENLLLRAAELGIGTVWCGVYPNKERVKNFRKLLEIPEHVIPFALVPVGYPAEHPEPEDRFKPERIHYEKW